MADKYVVIAGGNWSAAGTWSLTDGGAGGAGAPSATENAFLSNQSGNLVQDTAAAACLDLDFTKGTGYTGTFSGAVALAISGNLKLNGAMTRTYTGTISFQSTGASKTITCNGIALGGQISFIAGTDTYTLQDALSNGGATFSIQAGISFNSNGKALTAGSVLIAASCNITLGASAVSCTSWTCNTTATLSAASSSISLGGSFLGGGKAYGTVTLNVTQALAAVTGANSYGTLTYSSGAAALRQISIDNTQTVSGTFKYQGNSQANRLWLTSDVIGTQRTINAAAIDAASNFCDFMDIAGAGAAAPFATGTRIGDCGGNSGITPTAPAAQTATGTANLTWSTHGWTSRVPLPQDDVSIPNAFVAGRTITVDLPRIGKSITCTCTGNPAFSPSLGINLFGSLQFAAGMTHGGFTTHLMGRGAFTLTTAGVSFNSSVAIDGFGGSYTLGDALAVGAGGLSMANNMSLSDAGFSVSAPSFSMASTASLTRSGTWTLTGSGAVWLAQATNTISDTGTSKFTDATASAKTFAGGGKTYNNVWFNNAGTGTFDITGSNAFNDFKVDAGRSVRFTAGTTSTASSWTFGAGCTIGSITAANHTLAKSGGGTVSAAGATISRSTATPANTFFATSGSTDGGNNSGWGFSAIVAAAGAAAGVAVAAAVGAQILGAAGAAAGVAAATGVTAFITLVLTNTFRSLARGPTFRSPSKGGAFRSTARTLD